jgi:DNA repair ATPase RecN
MFEYIEYTICAGEGLQPEELKDRSRDGEFVFVRYLIIYFAVQLKVGSYKWIAAQYGRDHATVNHAIKAIKNYIDTDKKIKEKIGLYSEILGVVKEVSIKSENLCKMLEPLTKQISELETRCINIGLLVNNLKAEVDAIIETKVKAIR